MVIFRSYVTVYQAGYYWAMIFPGTFQKRVIPGTQGSNGNVPSPCCNFPARRERCPKPLLRPAVPVQLGGFRYQVVRSVRKR